MKFRYLQPYYFSGKSLANGRLHSLQNNRRYWMISGVKVYSCFILCSKELVLPFPALDGGVSTEPIKMQIKKTDAIPDDVGSKHPILRISERECFN